MNETLPNDDQIIRYLDNEMDEEERNQFEIELQKDNVLKERLLQLQIAVEAIREVGTTERVKGMHKEMMAEMQEGKASVTPVRKMIRASLAIAASVIFMVIAIGGWWLYQLSAEEVYQEHFVDYTVSTVRGIENTSATSSLYALKKYQAVIDQAATNQLSARDSFLVALSYLHENQNRAAIQRLQSLRASEDFKQDADYYLAMAYLKDKQYNEALILLNQIKEDKNHLYHQQVSDNLVRKVKMLEWK